MSPSPNTQLQSHRVGPFSWLITVQMESRAFRLWPWPTQQQPPSLEPPSSSMHRPATASRYWFPVTRWWSRVSVCCLHIIRINEVVCNRAEAGGIWYFTPTSITWPLPFIYSSIYLSANHTFQLPPVTSRPIRSEPPPPAPSPRGWSWPHPPHSPPRALQRKLPESGKSASWRTGMNRGGICVCVCLISIVALVLHQNVQVGAFVSMYSLTSQPKRWPGVGVFNVNQTVWAPRAPQKSPSEWTRNTNCVLSFLQRGSPWMSQEEEGVR